MIATVRESPLQVDCKWDDVHSHFVDGVLIEVIKGGHPIWSRQVLSTSLQNGTTPRRFFSLRLKSARRKAARIARSA